MNIDRLGFLGLIALIIVVIGLWNFLIRTASAANPDNVVAQTVSHFY